MTVTTHYDKILLHKSLKENSTCAKYPLFLTGKEKYAYQICTKKNHIMKYVFITQQIYRGS